MIRSRSRGFTLLELMVVVSIVGIIASVAVPQFINYQYRSRKAERAVIMRSIRVSIDDYFAREGRFPNGTAPNTNLLCNWNPDATPVTAKTPWRITGTDDWQRLPFAVDGAVYYRYYAYAQNQDGVRMYIIEGRGDLDGNGMYDDIEKDYIFNGAVLSKPAVAAANACDDCTEQFQLGAPESF